MSEHDREDDAVTDDAGEGGGSPDELFARLRASLESEHGQLDEQLQELDGTGGAGAFDENFADSGQVAAEQGESRVLAAQLREQLDDIERALERLDAGTYGSCEACGGTIGADRLEVMPATRWCIDHAR